MSRRKIKDLRLRKIRQLLQKNMTEDEKREAAIKRRKEKRKCGDTKKETK